MPSSFNIGSIGIVVIGRNEGERLARCLQSIPLSTARTVYVDSGSTDDSVMVARRAGAEVIELDARLPLTAARARNEGFRRLKECVPHVSYVLFVDGDCELASRWLEAAVHVLASRLDVAVVCGRRRERHPERSIYNLLCDIEWDTPIGEAKSCGGDSLMRATAFEASGGFRGNLIAGEEPELCARLRASGWRILRIGEDMTLHDADITQFWQWWRRALRGGYAFAQNANLHGERAKQSLQQSRSIWFWALGIPVVIICLALIWGPLAFVCLVAYPFQVIRVALKGKRSSRENWWYAFFVVLGKFPEMLGQLKFLLHRWLREQPRLIEYK